jgi:glycosyltransferase involved in cell wall biosynthesis
MRLRRIAWVVSYYKPAYVYGGPVRSISAMCEAIAQLEPEVTVLTTDANGKTRLDVPVGQPVLINGVTVWYYPLLLGGLSSFYSLDMARAVQRRISEFDIVVTEIMWGAALPSVARACRQANVPYVLPVRGQLMPWALATKSGKKRIYLKLWGWHVLNRAAALHCTDQVEAEVIQQLHLQSSTFVVPNGIDLTRFDRLPARGSLRGSLGIPADALVLLFLGRLTPIKRPDLAVKALAAALGAGHNLHLILAGPDENQMQPTLQAQAAAAGCPDRVHFAGLLKGEDVLSALVDADLLMMLSEVQENFGMAAVEALAAGVPILVSHSIPVGRTAREAGAGLAVDCSAEAIDQALAELLAAPARLKEMGQLGRAIVRARYDIRTLARQMLDQFESIIEFGRPIA